MYVLLLLLLVGALVAVFALLGKAKKMEGLAQKLNNDLAVSSQSLIDFTKATAKENADNKERADAANAKAVELQAQYGPLTEVRASIKVLNEKYKEALNTYHTLEAEIELYTESLDITGYGLYQPRYSFDLPEQYLVELEGNYTRQKEMVKSHKAVLCDTEWLVGGSKVEGRKMTNQSIKLMLFAFNGECDALIAKVRWNNVGKAKDRILRSFAEINKLGSVNRIEIVQEFLDLKLDELSLVYEYERKKHEQKEEQRLLREQMREEEKVQKELERAHREAEEEEKLYQKVLDKARQELGLATKEEAEQLNARILQLEEKLAEANARKERAIAQAQLTKIGNIYIISNIGSFGEDVYKIGMTRRFDPMERVRELSDAALPFQFDVHAVIYTENAPQFEKGLHRRFWEQRINLVNNRKEFFKVSLGEIEAFVREQGNVDIQFTKVAEAREYRQTLTLAEERLQKPSEEGAPEKFPETLIDME